ncbi:hypothetical protein ACMFMG_007893 [Clarireedia jacksonii]
MAQYNSCLDSFGVFGTAASSANIDCVSLFSTCRSNGTADNTCNSYNAQCKDKCSVIYGTCLSSGLADDSACMGQYNNCLDSFSTSASVDCVTSFTNCLNDGGAANDGDANDSACLTQYDNCLVSFDTHTDNVDCVTRYTTCEADGTADNDCSADNAQCKTDCSTSYSTCLSSGDSSLAKPCLNQYNQCLVSFAWETNTTTAGEDCVTKYMGCDDADNTCSASAAQCKNSCSTSYSTCLSSGDESLEAPCLMQYNSCLVSFNSTISKLDCTSSYLSCDLAENECSALNAACKNTCSVALDICRSSGDPALTAACEKQYTSCLVSFTAATSAIGESCVDEYLSCDEADNKCEALDASCKNRCATAYDTCNTSPDNTTSIDTPKAPQCLQLYDRCLVTFSTNSTIPAGQDCASKYYSCDGPANECNADYAQCKNSCGVARDTCRSSGDETLVSFCDALYNTCLDPVASTNITTNATSMAVLPTGGLRGNLSTGILVAASATVTETKLGSASMSVVPTGVVNATGVYVSGGSSSVAKISSAVVSAASTAARNGTDQLVHTSSAVVVLDSHTVVPVAAASGSVDLSGVGKAVADDECEVE